MVITSVVFPTPLRPSKARIRPRCTTRSTTIRTSEARLPRDTYQIQDGIVYHINSLWY